jgi:hypothetical protein
MMSKVIRHKPSASLVVAIIALVVAASGTAVAASSLVSGDGLIKKHSLSGNRLVNHTLTGKQINLNKLGKVPNAANADHATNANHATNADNATTAGAAVVAADVNGLLRWRKTVATPGADSTHPNTVDLATAGPFTIVGECYITGSNTRAGTFIRTSESGDAVQGYNSLGLVPFGPTDGTIQIANDIASGDTATHAEAFKSPDDGSWAAENANGTLTLDGFGNQGVYMQGASGPACSFSGFLVIE